MQKEMLTIEPSGGLSDTESPTKIDIKDAQDCQNVFTDEEGILKKVRGFHRVGRLPPQVVEDCEDAWLAKTNVSCDVDATDYKVGSASAEITIEAAFTTGLIATEIIDPAIDLSGYTKIVFWIKSDTTLASGVLQLCIDEHSACASPSETLNIGALTADTWSLQELTFAGATATRDAIISVGLNAASEPGTPVILIDDIICSHTCKRLYRYEKPDGSEILLGTDGSTLWRSTNGIDWTSVQTGLNISYVLDFATYRGKCWMCNGSDSMMSLDSNDVLVDYSKAQTEKTCTGATGGTVIVDSVNLTQADDYWKGQAVLIKDNSDSDEEYYAVITGSNQSATSITFSDIGITIEAAADEYTINGYPPPKGNILEVHNEKLFIAGQSDPSTIRFCNEDYGANEYESWTATGKTIEVNADDGDRITHLRHYADDMVIFKRYNFWRLYGWIDSYDAATQLTESESGVGCLYDHGVVIKDGVLCWIADKGFYAMDATYAPKRISDNKIEKLFENLTKPRFDWSYWLQTLQTDFEAGTYNSDLIDLTTVPGDIRLKQSEGAWLQTLDADFNAGIKVGVAVGDDTVYLDTVLFSNTTKYEEVGSTYVEVGSSDLLTYTAGISEIRVGVQYTSSGGTMYLKLDLCNESGAVQDSQEFSDITTAWQTGYKRWTLGDYFSPTDKYRVKRYIRSSHSGGQSNTKNFYVLAYEGTFTSQSHDTTLAEPSWKTFEANVEANGGTLIYATQVSADNSDWDDEVTVTLGQQITSASKRYIKVKIYFTGNTETLCPVVSDFTVNVGDTVTAGDLLGQSKDTTLTNPIWGTFEVSETPNGQVITYKTLVSADNSAWDGEVVATPGKLIASGSKRYIKWRAYLTSDGSKTASVHNVTLNWSEHSATTESLIDSVIHDRRAYWAGTMKGQDYNDTLVILDRNNNFQQMKDINIGVLELFNQGIFFGSAKTGCGDIYIFDSGRNFTLNEGDTAIDGYWIIKKLGGSQPERIKIARKFWLVANKGTGTLLLGYQKDDGSFTDISIDLSGSGIYNEMGWFPSGVRYKFITLRYANNTIDEGFEIIGMKLEQDICNAQVTS